MHQPGIEPGSRALLHKNTAGTRSTNMNYGCLVFGLVGHIAGRALRIEYTHTRARICVIPTGQEGTHTHTHARTHMIYVTHAAI